MKTAEILIILISVIGLIMSFYFYFSRRKSEKESLKILSSRINEIESNLALLEKKALKESDAEINNIELSNSEISIYQAQLTEIHQLIKNKILNQIDEKDREVVLSNLQQRYLGGRVDYLNKLLNRIGSDKYVSIIKHKKVG